MKHVFQILLYTILCVVIGLLGGHAQAPMHTNHERYGSENAAGGMKNGEVDASASGQSLRGDTVIIDSIYKPFADIKKLSGMVRVNYRCWRNGKPLTDVFILDLDSADNPPFCIHMGLDNKAGACDANISLDERMNFVRIALQNISNDYGLCRLRQMFITASGFGDAFILINKEIDKSEVKSEAMISSVFKNRRNKIIAGISRLLEGHGLAIKDICIEKVLRYSRNDFLKYADFSGNASELPKFFYEPVSYEITIGKAGE